MLPSQRWQWKKNKKITVDSTTSGVSTGSRIMWLKFSDQAFFQYWALLLTPCNVKHCFRVDDLSNALLITVGEGLHSFDNPCLQTPKIIYFSGKSQIFMVSVPRKQHGNQQ